MDDFGNANSVEGTASDLPSLKSEISYTYPTTDSSTYTVTASDQRGKTYSETYDCEKGTLLSTTDPKNVSTAYTYDDDNDRLLSIARGNQSVEYTYDDFGKLTGISHEGTSYSFGYDKFNNRTTTAVGNRVLSTNTYDSNNGNLLQMTYGNGDYVTYAYNRFGTLETISYDGTEVVRNFTDSAGNVIRTQDYLTNLEHRVTYDSTGRLISKDILDLSVGIGTSSDRWLRSLEYDFDLNNNLTHFAYADNQGSNVVTYAYGDDNLLSKTTLDNEKAVTYNYDTYGRMTGKTLDTTNPLTHSYTFMQSERGEDYTTTLVETETIGNTTYKYTYDSYGNIEDIYLVNSDGTTSRLVSYSYDDYNQLVTVNDKVVNTYTSYTYDESGNITRELVQNLHPSYGYPVSVQGDVSYTYGDSQWKDLLTAYNGQTITYDAIGNPLTYRDGITMTWQNGRELASYSDDSYDIEYTYDASGMRTVKDIAGLGEVCYVYEGGLLLRMDYLDYFYNFSYDANGTPIGFQFTTPSGTDSYYYYGLNSRGDIIAVYDSEGTKVATYSYDAYGKPVTTNILNTNHTFAINNNPLRYRGYVYDKETGFYYLQSRYYDPTTCRFLNTDTTDILTATPTAHTDKNLFAYCDNNPISRFDTGGKFWGLMALGGVIGAVVNTVSSVVSQVVSTGTVNWKSVAVSAASGFVSGAISASPLGLVGQTVAGGIIEGATYVADCWVNNKSVNVGQLALNTGLGVISGYLGGPGANKDRILSNNMKVAKKTLNSNKNKSGEYAAKVVSSAKTCRRDIMEGFVSDTVASSITNNISSTITNSGYDSILEPYLPYSFRMRRLM